MEQDKPSLTGWAVATRRAVHQLIDRPRVLEDPLDVRIVGGTGGREAIHKSQNSGEK